MTDRIAPLLRTWEPAIRSSFLGAVKGITDEVRLNDLTGMLKALDYEGAVKAVGLAPVKFRPLVVAVESTFEAGGVDATLAIRPTRGPLGLEIRPSFDVTAPAADQWRRERTTGLVRQITEDQRDLIRQAMAPLLSGLDPIVTGQTPQKIALDLVGRVNRLTGRRDGGIIGLTSQQADWARNYGTELAGVPPNPSALTRKLRDRRFDRTVKRAIAEGKEIPASTREAMTRNYKNKALRYRANTIAGNEASTALHESQVEAWEQAIDSGVADENKVRRFWFTAGDDAVRPHHAAVPGLNPSGVGLRAAFNTPIGPALQPGWSFEPGCRCIVRVRVVG